MRSGVARCRLRAHYALLIFARRQSDSDAQHMHESWVRKCLRYQIATGSVPHRRGFRCRTRLPLLFRINGNYRDPGGQTRFFWSRPASSRSNCVTKRVRDMSLASSRKCCLSECHITRQSSSNVNVPSSGGDILCSSFFNRLSSLVVFIDELKNRLAARQHAGWRNARSDNCRSCATATSSL